MNLLELIERVKTEARELSPDPNKKHLDDGIIAELVLPRALDLVVIDLVKDTDGLNALRADHTITFTAGVGTLPSTVKEEYVNSIYFKDSLDEMWRNFVSYEPRYEDFILSGPRTIVDTFTVANGNIYYCETSSKFGDFSGQLVINAITTPTIPTVTTDTVNLKSNILNKLIAVAASIVNRGIPLEKVALDNVQ